MRYRIHIVAGPPMKREWQEVQNDYTLPYYGVQVLLLLKSCFVTKWLCDLLKLALCLSVTVASNNLTKKFDSQDPSCICSTAARSKDSKKLCCAQQWSEIVEKNYHNTAPTPRIIIIKISITSYQLSAPQQMIHKFASSMHNTIINAW